MGIRLNITTMIMLLLLLSQCTRSQDVMSPADQNQEAILGEENNPLGKSDHEAAFEEATSSAPDALADDDFGTRNLIKNVEDLLGQSMTVDVSKRLIGGSLTSASIYPFMAAVYVNGTFRCGGALVSTKFVITAASCFCDTYGDLIREGLSVELINSDLNELEFYSVFDIIPQPNFTYPDGQDLGTNNILLIRLSHSAPSSHVIQIIQSTFDPSSATSTLFLGWGAYNSSGLPSPYLREISFSLENCGNRTETINSPYCASIGLCSYDEGGPLFAIISGLPVLLGVASALTTCETLPSLAVFANLLEQQLFLYGTIPLGQSKPYGGYLCQPSSANSNIPILALLFISISISIFTQSIN